jgi:ABC-type nitrate/sulfonate/bicarbonate transport system substrate-binding protein
LKTIRFVVFPGAFNWPVWVAGRMGWFAEAGLEVRITCTPGSVFQLTGLMDGAFDLGITLIDNVVAYREGQGEVPAVGKDLVGLMAHDTRTFPTLVTLPEVRSYGDLRGRTLSLDATTTGYAMVLYAMLEKGGLGRSDYRIESVGGVKQRFDALLARQHAGALFNSPFESLLEAQGFTRLDTARAVLSGYQGMVVAGRREWIAANRAAVGGFLRALLRAIAWLYDPANRTAAFKIHDEEIPGAPANSAATAYGILFHPEYGLPRDGRIDHDAVAAVLDLRSRFGVPARRLGAPQDYYDLRYLDEAKKIGD